MQQQRLGKCQHFARGRCSRGSHCQFEHGERAAQGAGGGGMARGRGRGRRRGAGGRPSRGRGSEPGACVPHCDGSASTAPLPARASAPEPAPAPEPKVHIEDAPIGEELQEELELLKEIYTDEVTIDGRCVSMVVRPRAAHQFVRVTAAVVLGADYPTSAPTLRLSRPLGLSEQSLSELRAAVAETSAELAGDAMAYQLLECITEFVSAHDMPSEVCAICRGDFAEPPHVLVTPCEHFFHPWCVQEWGEHLDSAATAEEETRSHAGPAGAQPTPALCPVCRTGLDMPALRHRAGELEGTGVRVVSSGEADAVDMADWRTPAIVAAQRARERVRAKQAAKGGLIEKKTEILIREATAGASGTS